MPEPKHIPQYFKDGIRQPECVKNHLVATLPCYMCVSDPFWNPAPVEDATGFPYDDNTAGEALAPEPNEALKAAMGRYVEEMKHPELGGHPDFYKILDEMKSLYSAKHYQYATDADPMVNFRLCGDLIHKMLKPGIRPTIAAALCLMSKQIVGVYEIVGEGKTNTIESLQDKLRDIGIYSVILQILVGEKIEK